MAHGSPATAASASFSAIACSFLRPSGPSRLTARRTASAKAFSFGRPLGLPDLPFWNGIDRNAQRFVFTVNSLCDQGEPAARGLGVSIIQMILRVVTNDNIVTILYHTGRVINPAKESPGCEPGGRETWSADASEPKRCAGFWCLSDW